MAFLHVKITTVQYIRLVLRPLKLAWPKDLGRERWIYAHGVLIKTEQVEE